MYAATHLRRKSKPAPVRSTIILFDATRFRCRDFGVTEHVPAPSPVEARIDAVLSDDPRDELYLLTAADFRRIDSARRDAYSEVRDHMPESEAIEYAAEEARRTARIIREEKQVTGVKPLGSPVRKAPRERREPYTAADSLWWFQQADARDRLEAAMDRIAEQMLDEAAFWF